jgi:hypothetical protein
MDRLEHSNTHVMARMQAIPVTFAELLLVFASNTISSRTSAQEESNIGVQTVPSTANAY